MVAQKEQVKEKDKPVWTKKHTLPEVTTSWHNYMCKGVIQDLKHSILQVSEGPYDERIISALPTSHFEFPNGYNQVIIYKLLVESLPILNILKSICVVSSLNTYILHF